MFIRSMYKWAASEEVSLIERNPVANFRMPKAPQDNKDVVVIPKNELSLILIALKSKSHHKSVD